MAARPLFSLRDEEKRFFFGGKVIFSFLSSVSLACSGSELSSLHPTVSHAGTSLKHRDKGRTNKTYSNMVNRKILLKGP